MSDLSDDEPVPDPELDAIEELALKAWRAAPDHCPDESFVARVMAAVEASQPRLLVVDAQPALPAPKPRRRARFAIAAAAIAAGVILLPRLLPRESATAVVAGTVDDGTNAQETLLPQPLPADLDARIEQYLADWGRNYGPAFRFHGVVVVSRDGAVLYRRAFGVADPATGRANDSDTRFRLGLLTEPFTALAVLQLQADGRLRLDDSVATILPDWPHGEQITIRQLLTHRSGLPNYTDDPRFPAWKGLAHTTDEMLERLRAWPPEFVPGTATLPSNTNYYLLGAIVERVTGESFGDYLQTHVFAPAGMTSTSFGDAWESGRQARGNVWNEDEGLDPPDTIDMSTFGAAGGIVSTAEDLARWDAALLDGRLLPAAQLEQMFTADEGGYGLGWVISQAYDQPLASFPGAIDGYSGALLRFLGDGTTVIVLANTEVVPGVMVASDIAQLVYGDEAPKRDEPAEIKIAPGTYTKYLGTYALSEVTRAAFAGGAAEQELEAMARVSVQQIDDRLYFDVPGHARSWMHPMGRNRFFFKDHSGTRLFFELGVDRHAERLFVSSGESHFEFERMPGVPAPATTWPSPP